MNMFKTFLLMLILTVVFVVIGYAIGGQQGMIIAFVLAVIMNFSSYWFSDKIVLSRYKAHEVTPEQAPEIYGIVRDLTQRAGLPMPRVFVVPDASPNAFATGRNPKHAVVAVTQGLLNNMNKQELTGVIAHELSHVKNRHILIGSIAATMAGAIMVIANIARFGALMGSGNNRNNGGGNAIFMLLTAIVAPVAAMLIQMAISRSDEFDADATGAQIAGSPQGLASALGKLDAISKQIPMQNASDATAHMFIVNPLSARQAFAKLFSTHPPTSERIKRLVGSGYSSTSPHGEDQYISNRPADNDYAAPRNQTPDNFPPRQQYREPTAEERARDDWDRLSGR